MNIDSTRNVLALGSVPTENIPTKSHEDRKPAVPRRTLIRSESSTSTSTFSQKRDKDQFKAFLKQLNKENLDPWKVDWSDEGTVKFELCENVHCLPKYTTIVDSAL